MAGRRSSLLTANKVLLIAVISADEVALNEVVSSAEGSLGKLSGVLSHYFVLPIITGDLDAEVLIDIKSERLIRNIL